MAQAMDGRFKQIVSIVTFLLCVLAANLASALDSSWLSSQQSSDGSLVSTEAVSTTFQATSEAIQAIYALGESTQPWIPAAIQYLESDTFQSTEHLARRIMVIHVSGGDASEYVGELTSRSGPDGGFGELPGYDSTAIDTAYALEAMASAGLQLSDTASYAIAYLLDRQDTDGGWSNRPNVSSVYVTALVSSALQSYRHHYLLNDAIERANGFLLSKRNAQGAIGDAFETALAIIAMAPVTYDQSIYQDTVDYLTSLQLADGSWGNDVFTTALALHALNAVQTSVPANPSAGIVSGRVTDSVTGSPLENVEVSVSGGSQVKSSTTDAHGLYVITNIAVGSVSLSARLDGYLSLTASGSAVAGQTLNFSPGLARDPTPGLLHLTGTVTDGTDGSWLHNASVRILNTNYSASTDTGGSFTINGVPPGSYTVEISHTGYAARLFSLSSPNGGSTNFGKLSLLPANAQVTTGTVRGRIANSTTGGPLPGVEVILGDSGNSSAITDDNGRFQIDGVTPGNIAFTASLSGYHGASGVTTVIANTSVTLNISLLSVDEDVSGTVEINGNIVDAATLQALQGAHIQIKDSNYNALADDKGSFAFTGIPAGAINVEVSQSGYFSKYYSVSAPNGGSVALGSIGLVQDSSAATTGAIKGMVKDAVSGTLL